jgi:5'-methylthioadenosine phosphorylase
VKPTIAIIGGSGVSSIVKGEQSVVGTPFGPGPTITTGDVKGRKVVFLPRHGEGHTAPPHRINYRANIWSLKQIGVERIIATNAVGAIDKELEPGEIVLPSDLVDFTKSRRNTFYDEAPVTHLDVSEPYCPVVRKSLVEAATSLGKNADRPSVMACTEGPRYETPAEIRMMDTLGCGIVGMTGAPEAFLARELEMCYASVCFVSNMAAGLQRTLSAKEVEERGHESGHILNKIIIQAIERIPESRKGCSCARALSSAQLAKDEEKEPGK